MTPLEALRKASQHIGGDTELAKRLGITVQAVGQWQRVPAERVISVEKACEGIVKRHELRPDLYPPEDVAKSGEAA